MPRHPQQLGKIGIVVKVDTRKSGLATEQPQPAMSVAPRCGRHGVRRNQFRAETLVLLTTAGSCGAARIKSVRFVADLQQPTVAHDLNLYSGLPLVHRS
jgi:hypothetical protein